MSDLLPCPFCGSNPVFYGGPADNQCAELWWVCCESCCVSHTCEESKAAAAEAWNRRAQPAQAVPKVKESHFAPQDAVTDDGWTEWVCPKPNGYLAQCCDCDLVHEVDTRVVKYEPRPSDDFEVVTDPDLQVQWRVRRRDDLRSEIRGNPAFEPAPPSAYVNAANINASDMPGTVVQKLDAAFHAQPAQDANLEAGKSRFYPAQAVLVYQDLRAMANAVWAQAEHEKAPEAFVTGAAGSTERPSVLPDVPILAQVVPLLSEAEVGELLDAARVPELPNGYENLDMQIARAVEQAVRAKLLGKEGA